MTPQQWNMMSFWLSIEDQGGNCLTLALKQCVVFVFVTVVVLFLNWLQLELPVEQFQKLHLRFEFRHCSRE